ncbi:hypothetical protein U14_05608 [Candidatus Moduliflexus flocculans]|uniref:Uncharacterized protein n=1 Tax=Candidatus Moduliflexus flocculans TaxID=1499966 RepID=A0A081BSE2_9BACT|nr:hypothetical protein U14_05608 [Candidatus Moduliflexus flocculans]
MRRLKSMRCIKWCVLSLQRVVVGLLRPKDVPRSVAVEKNHGDKKGLEMLAPAQVVPRYGEAVELCLARNPEIIHFPCLKKCVKPQCGLC